ncbi:ABC transporter substrate-binding protein [Uliginosibacterium gangwonense]|uniref:ABC transporter substrate-binding protein n=1 Tax=Uliginosibacterium gangwonense TaxID=392736 RepID=UPI0003601331|nr:ABC transporter substrate-binding protein [Uliginosibacterium gangwonense]
MKQRIIPLLLASLSVLAVTSASAADKPLKSIGVSVGDLANPFFVAIGKGAEEAAKKINPNVKVTTLSTKYDLNTQVSQIENFIANKTDLLLVNAVDPKAIAPTLKKAREAGMVVIAIDVAAEGADYTVMSDNVAAGANACEYIAKKLNGKGKVVIVNGPPVSAVIDRVAGCKKTFAKNPGIKVLSDNQDAKGSRDGGMAVMQDLLTANPKIDAVFAINDPTAIGAELAIKQAKREGIFITAVDGAPDAVVALNDPKSLLEGSSAQNPYAMATEGVKIGYEMLNGKKPASKVKLLPVPLITKANVKTYPGWVKE